MRHACLFDRGHVVIAQTILGIDSGAHGAIGVLDEDVGLLEVVNRPSTPEANGRIVTNAPFEACLIAPAALRRRRGMSKHAHRRGTEPVDFKHASRCWTKAVGRHADGPPDLVLFAPDRAPVFRSSSDVTRRR
jgi:hypothetical protein